jgi:hypothetical protein
MAARNERDFGATVMPADGLNEISTGPVFDAAFRHMRRWAAGGPPPPSMPPAEVAGDPPQVARDDDGYARGGVRLPQTEVPIASVQFDGTNMLGTYTPFSPAELRARYRDRATFEAAAQAAVDAEVLLAPDRDRLVADAAATFPLA